MHDKNHALEEWWPSHFAQKIIEKYEGSLEAVLLYGSWLRGKRDTLPDFYVILSNYDKLPSVWQKTANRILEPNVYRLVLNVRNQKCSAKYATISLKHLERKIKYGFHPYLWARFSQPTDILYTRNRTVLETLTSLTKYSEKRMINETLGMLAPKFTSRELWGKALTLTYASELRAESSSKIISLVDDFEPYFEIKTAEHAKELGIVRVEENTWSFNCSRWLKIKSKQRWKLRRALGIFLSTARLLKATCTFNDPLQYLLWKIERHTGVKESATALQLKYPLIFSLGLLWRIYRKGGFK